MLPSNYFNNPDNVKEITNMILDKNISMKAIQLKYGFSRQRLYQIITMLNLPTKYKHKRNKFKEKYGHNPVLYQLKHSLEERKSYYNKTKGTIFQDATIEDLLVEGRLPKYCPVFGVELDYSGINNMNPNVASIDKIDNTKGYIKGNVAIISWKANKIKNEGSLKEHEQIVTYMKDMKIS